MSNEENTEKKFTYVCSESGNALSIHGSGEVTLAPVGEEIWRGSPQELAALVRDARRFRRMERAHRTPCNGHGWGEKMHDFEPPAKTLAEIADALPEVEG